MDYKKLSEKLVQTCLKKGADAAEVFIQSGRNLSIRVRNGDIDVIQESSSHGVGFRVLVKGRIGFSHCNDLSESSLDNTLASAIDFAKYMTPDEYNVLPGDQGLSKVDGLYDSKIGKISMDKKIDLIKTVEELAMRDSRITKSGGSSYGESEVETYIANSNGISKNYTAAACNYSVYVVAEKGDQKSSGGDGCSRRFFNEFLPPEKVAENAAKRAYEMLDPRMVKTQKAAVIFDPDVSRSLLGGILGAVNGERVLQGASFLRDKLNRKIAVEALTIIDDGIRPKGLSSKPFDGEGVPTQKRTIVDKGVLKGFMYNTIIAKRAGVKSTGNASRRGFTSLPGIGSHAFYMTEGTTDPEDIIKATKKGLYLKGATGYGINPVSGSFSGGARGFWIEDGKIAFPVKDLTIASEAFDMFNNIDMVGNDLDLDNGRSAPTFRIREIQIGGE